MQTHVEKVHINPKEDRTIDAQCPHCDYNCDKTSSMKKHIFNIHINKKKSPSRSAKYREIQRLAKGEFKDYFDKKGTKSTPKSPPKSPALKRRRLINELMD